MINKKIAIILGIVLVVLVLGGLAFYQYSASNSKNIQEQQENNTLNSNSTQQPQQGESNTTTTAPDNQVQLQGVQAQGSNNVSAQGGLQVCVDKCGDGICQKTATSDSKDLNSVCPETAQDCPADCK